MMKKGFAILLISLVFTALASPFSISASGIDGFDYSNYFEADYVVSDGAAYIDSGVKPDRNTIVEASFYGGTSGTFFGVNSSGSSTGFYRLYIDSSSYKARIVTSNVVSFSGSLYTGQFNVVINPRGTSEVGSYTYATSRSNTDTASRNMYILAYNSQGSVSSYSDARLYYLYIKDYSSDSYTHKLYPAVRKSDNEVGLYDTVTSSFYASSGSGSLQYGSLVGQQYTVSTSVYPSTGGTVSGGGTYSNGSTAVLTASPASGYQFDSWSNGSTANPLNLIVNGDISITANFLPTMITEEYTISASVSPSGSGSVTGTGTYQQGTTVTLTASPASGYVFDHWSNGSTSNPLTFSASENIQYTAYFVPEQSVTTFSISASVDPSGSGSVTGTGTYQQGTTVTLTASPASGYIFNGWYLNDQRVHAASTYTILVDQDYSFVAKFEASNPSSGWTDWTDSMDRIELQDITDSFGVENLSLQIVERLVVDQMTSSALRMSFNSQSGVNVSFTGTYYDNTVHGLEMCNSTSYTQTNSDTSPVENITIRPHVAGQIGVPGIANINFGIDVVDENLGNSSTATSTVTNRTEACRLIGTMSDDTALNNEMWESIGYEAVTASDNDNGYTAMLYVPGDEEFQFSTRDLDALISAITASFTNMYFFDYHYEYDIYVTSKLGSTQPLPEYGQIETPLSLWQFLHFNDQAAAFNYSDDFYKGFYLYDFSLMPDSQYMYTTGRFKNHISDNFYDRNETIISWSGTRSPVWHLKTESMRGYTNNLTEFQNIFSQHVPSGSSTFDLYAPNNWMHATNISRSSFDDTDWFAALTSEQASKLNLTAGVNIYTAGADVSLYQLHDNSLLNRFNQLGSFLNGWFSRIYNSVSNITGGSESNDITNNIINDNDINIDTDITQIITNVQDNDSNIDLTSPDLVIDPNHLNNISELSPVASETVKSFTDNGIGIILFLPLILGILGMIL